MVTQVWSKILNIIETKNLNIIRRNKILIKNLTFSIKDNQCWVVLGRNGSGKSSFLKAMAGLDPYLGEIFLVKRNIEEYSVKNRAQKLGLLLQQSAFNFQSTVLEMTLSGGFPHQQTWGFESQDDLDRAIKSLKKVEMSDLINEKIESLSGGELRRVEISRLLHQNPVIAMLDEPLNNLDLNHQIKILALLRDKFCSEGKSLLITLHDINLTLKVATHLLLLKGNGEWIAGQVELLGRRKILSEYLDCKIIEHQTQNGSLFTI